jgi:hypothetical protein
MDLSVHFSALISEAKQFPEIECFAATGWGG